MREGPALFAETNVSLDPAEICKRLDHHASRAVGLKSPKWLGLRYHEIASRKR